ncbi:MAG: phytanoyl-CoA dioxygenase family protein [Pseudomonadales bacterium]
MLQQNEIETFRTAGYIPLRGGVPKSDVDEMCERIWELMAEQGIERNDSGSWIKSEHTHRGLKAVSQLHRLKQGEPSPEDYPNVRAALDCVFEPGERAPAKNWGQVLVTLPVAAADAWLMPSSVWHFDHWYGNPGEVCGVNVFLLIADVEAGGGGTAVVRNSPRLMDRLLNSGAQFEKLSDQNKGFCSSHPWLRGLKVPRKAQNVERNACYMDADTDLDGIPVRVEELTGSAGDVFLCHPALLHAPAINTSSQPRLMRTQRVYTKALRDLIAASSNSS